MEHMPGLFEEDPSKKNKGSIENMPEKMTDPDNDPSQEKRTFAAIMTQADRISDPKSKQKVIAEALRPGTGRFPSGEDDTARAQRFNKFRAEWEEKTLQN